MHPVFLVKQLLKLPLIAKITLAVFFDVAVCITATVLAFYLRLGDLSGVRDVLPLACLFSIVVAIPIFFVFGLYRTIFRYAGSSVLPLLSRPMLLYTFIFGASISVLQFDGIPRTVGFIQPFVLGLGIAGSRIFITHLIQYSLLLTDAITIRKNALIFGCEQESRQLFALLSMDVSVKVVGFIDENLCGRTIYGLPVVALAQTTDILHKLSVQEIFIAGSSLPQSKRNEITSLFSNYDVSVRSHPLLNESVLNSGLNEMDLGVDNLLGREPVYPDSDLLASKVTNRVVCVTGAGGSIGSELCRQILKLTPKILIIVDNSEHAIYSISEELLESQRHYEHSDGTTIVPILGSVTDRGRMLSLFEKYGPDTLYHAAAYKHVPLVEANIAEGIKNNVFGTLNIATLALQTGISDCALISTDKAVRSTNIMGCTKRLSEMIFQALSDSADCKTIFSIVRFGNVLASSGSVIPKFREQIRRGGPITLTHPEITRFFMTIPEAAQLVLQASAMAEGGEVFVLDMGEPIKIIDLARRMIRLSGRREKVSGSSGEGIKIEITGLRPGEKMYEELLIGDKSIKTRHPKIMKADEARLTWENLTVNIERLAKTLELNDEQTMSEELFKMVEDNASGNPDVTGRFYT